MSRIIISERTLVKITKHFFNIMKDKSKLKHEFRQSIALYHLKIVKIREHTIENLIVPKID